MDTYKSHQKSKPFIIGVDGLSGSGKTTLSKKLLKYIQSQGYKLSSIHLDDHISLKSSRYNTGHEEWFEYYYLQWDIELLTEQLFKRVNNKANLYLPFYNKLEDDYVYREIQVRQKDFCIIEGIFLQRAQWKPYLDFTVYLDCPRDIRYKRIRERERNIGNKREIVSKNERRYWPGEEYYLRVEQPKAQADFIIKKFKKES
ncbi:kinase [Alkalibacillus haloalkaliphilus]|uniref:kinase n=1 Tax=Alkalibacillus haloalkaliphilus TaxID=94136 RepID=UPI0002E39C51|nr:kinase [Alkalibacillus haloalkaliphilus]